jgi:hypothetical protein
MLKLINGIVNMDLFLIETQIRNIKEVKSQKTNDFRKEMTRW